MTMETPITLTHFSTDAFEIESGCLVEYPISKIPRATETLGQSKKKHSLSPNDQCSLINFVRHDN